MLSGLVAAAIKPYTCHVTFLGQIISFRVDYKVSYDLRSLLQESVPYVKIYRYNPKHLYPKLNG
jgi:hypothetical protein